jgi:hypothetical protein
MDALAIAVIALAIGGGLGAWAVLRWRRSLPHEARSALRIESRLEVQSAELRRLADAAGARDAGAERLRAEFAAARRSIDELSTRERERREREDEAWNVIRRLATVLAGGSAKGRAGENVLREHLSELPSGMFVTDLRVNGKVVEYALQLPDGRSLPIDSKWSADRELEALEAAEDPVEREALARTVERVVAGRVREVATYLDPSVTSPVAVAAVPDAAYAVLRRAHADAFARGVIVVPYSTALPVLLFVYSLVSRYGAAGDVSACLADVSSLLEAISGVVENKIARAATMISNGADDLRSSLGKARASLARARGSEEAREDEGVLRAVP